MPDDDRPPSDSPSPPPPPSKPPLLDYPSPPRPDERDTESWAEVGRAMAIVFGFILALFVVGFGICGTLFRGC